MKTADFDYHLPSERIAQSPIEPRDSARLMVLDRVRQQQSHSHFYQLKNHLRPGDMLVLNHSRVIPARLRAYKIPGGGKAELLLLERISSVTWKAMVGGKGLHMGKQLELENGLKAEIVETLSGPQRIVRFDKSIDQDLEKLGEMPLPPYIHKSLKEKERYQTVFAKHSGSSAAPTAGLHFTPELISGLEDYGVKIAKLTLHIGLDTFAPVTEDNPQKHIIHSEWCELTPKVAQSINQCKAEGGRIIAVGTTSVRVLESAAQKAQSPDRVAAFTGRTNLFILPGFQFRVVDALVTNFHLPRSTLLMMISAFAGRDFILESYRQAIEENYRFYSFGDAMLIS